MTGTPITSNPSASAAAAASGLIPSRPAARHTSIGSPVGSAAATSNSCLAAGGRASHRRRKVCSIRSGSAGALGTPNPPASSCGVSPRGNSTNASGLPRISARIRSRTCSSSGTRRNEPSSARASVSSRPWTRCSGNPVNSSPGSRAANISATGSASSRRATNASACAEARSSQCASSTTHSSGRSPATSDRRLSTASPTRKRSGGCPACSPNATPSASRCGPGSSSSRSSAGTHSWWRAANASSISDSTPAARAIRNPEADSIAYSSSAVLPIPGSPRNTRALPIPPRAAASSESTAARSVRRSTSITSFTRNRQRPARL
jgi:hypothetical protein